MIEKPIVFISHIAEEAVVAAEFKRLIEESFLGLIDVFVSSDARSIELGDRWLDEITRSLRSCVIEFIFCSPISVRRPWINFEAGSGWVRNIPVVPLCHSGITPTQLPLPLNLLQAANLNEVSSLKLVFGLLSSVLKSNIPSADLSGFTSKVRAFEEQYTFWRVVNSEFSSLKQLFGPGFDGLLNSGQLSANLTEVEIREVRNVAANIVQFGAIMVFQSGGSTMTPNGVFYGYTLELTEKGKKIVADERFMK